MVHLVATLANDADHMPSLLYALRNDVALPVKAAANQVWGVGYYTEDRALIIRKPAEILTSGSVFELAPNVHSSIILACVKDGEKSLDHAPPYRFRSWLFGYTGDLSSLDGLRGRILEKLPDFILHEIGEGGGGALACGMFIGELHRAGLLADALAPQAAFAQALQRTMEAVKMLAQEAGVARPEAALVATNGRMVIATRAGAPLYTKTQDGLESSPHGPANPSLGEFKRVAEALKRFRAVILTHEVVPGRPGWTEVQDGATLFVDRKLGVSLL